MKFENAEFGQYFTVDNAPAIYIKYDEKEKVHILIDQNANIIKL